MSEFIELKPKTWSMQHYIERNDQQEIIIRHGHIAITNYNLGDNKQFERSLSVYNEMYYRYDVVGFYYVKRYKELRINRNYNLNRLAHVFPNARFRMDLHGFKSMQENIILKTPPRDDVQKLCLSFLAGMGKYQWITSETQRFVQLRPGSGKTYMLCACSAYYSARTVVVMPLSILVEQWVEAYTTFTNIKKDEILVVRGSKKCEDIRKGKHKDKKVFLFLMDTLTSYHDTYGDMKTSEMLEATRAYLFGVDECHMDFRALSTILALQDFSMTVYLTASPDRTEKKESWMYKTLFAEVPRFGENVFHKSEKYLNVIIKEYKYVPTPREINRINTKMGMNTKLYENALIDANPSNRQDFDDAFILMLNWSKKQMKDEHRLLVLTNTIEGAQYMSTLCEKVFDKSEVGVYYGTMPKDQKKDAMEKRIICATASSCGTGFDMPNLTVCMNVMAYGSKVMATQLPGRVRKPKDGSPGIYIEFVNTAYYKCYNQYKNRKATLANHTPNGKLIVIN